MRAPFTQLYLHCVWATWDRLPLISPLNEQPIYAAIQSKCQELKCFVVAVGGTSDHLHLLVRFPTTVTVANLVKEVKGASSHLVTHQINVEEFFKWQGAYGAFTVTKNLVPHVKAYVERQKQHHAEDDLWQEWEQTFSDE
jgi:REP element-mobilizing transposase RayT